MSSSSTTLAQRLQSAEKSIAFIQREHAATLTNLHEEISKWQQKCSDLTFQMAIGGGTVTTSSTDDQKLRTNIDELKRCRETIRQLNELLDEKTQTLAEFENRLVVNERKHAADLRAENEKQRQLKSELEQRSTLIAQLTTQLYREKQKQTSPVRSAPLGPFVLPDRPKKVVHATDESKERLSNRSGSLNSQTHGAEPNLNQLLFIGRRPATPPQQLRPISSKDKAIFTKRQLQLLSSHSEENGDARPPRKLAPIVNRKVVLPPLAASGKFQQEAEI